MMLAPFQQTAFNQIRKLLSWGYLIDFYGPPGSGKTLLLKELRKEIPGWLVHLHDLMDCFEKEEPGHGKDIWFYRYVKSLLDNNAVLYIDDYKTVQQVCSNMSAGWEMMRKALANQVLAAGKRIVFVGAPGDAERSFSVTMPPITPDDRRFLLTAMLGREAGTQLDLAPVWAEFPDLNGHQLRRVSTAALKSGRPLSTDLILQLVQEWSGQAKTIAS